jgi:hypothetical protein
MLCEACHQKLATVHIERTKRKALINALETIDQFEHHFCSDCAVKFREQERAFFVLPGSRTEKVRVMSISSDRTVLRVIGSDPNAPLKEWSVLTSRIPSQVPVDGEVTVTFTEAELDWLKGNRDTI